RVASVGPDGIRRRPEGVDELAAQRDRRAKSESATGSAVEPGEGTLARGDKPTGEVPRDGDEAKRSSESQHIGPFIRAQREAAEVSIRQRAERAGVSSPYLSAIERGRRKASADRLRPLARR